MKLPAAGVWNTADTKPTARGEFKVRFPQCKAEGRAIWDGALWRDTSNGLECYFQSVEWAQ